MSRHGRRKQAPEKEPNLERWLISYADFITLLFAVFVTLYAMSVVDKAKVEAVKSSIQSSFGMTQEGPVFSVIDSPALDKVVVVPEQRQEAGPGRGSYAGAEDFGRIQQELTGRLAADGGQGTVDTAVTERGLVVSLKEGGLFPSGSATIQPQALPRLAEIANALSGYANLIRVEGYTDNVPVAPGGAFASNWELSSARANAIVHYLADQRGFPGAKLSATGYGEYRPMADNSTEEGRRRNRRVDIVLLSKSASQGEPGAALRGR